MYVQMANRFTKIIGQIAEFKRSGGLLASGATAGIKSRKENIQLLGPHAQTVVSPQPVFYFIPAKQEADAGVNAGDLILMRLEEKSERRQVEVAAHGLRRGGSGISLTRQVQLLRSEVKSGVYKIAPATALSKGEYALYLSPSEGMAPYVYDFGVQEGISSVAVQNQRDESRPANMPVVHNTGDASAKPSDVGTSPRIFKEATIGAFSNENPNVRHDGVTLTAVTEGGPADRVGIQAGDVILSIDNHYVFTVTELKEEISHHEPGTKIAVRYRRRAIIYDVPLTVGRRQ
jgi:hypothetical protein